MDDEQLLRRVEAVLAEIDRSQGLSDEHASVLAVLRIRLHGGPRESLEELLEAAGSLKGKRALEDVKPPERSTGSLEDAMRRPPRKPGWPGL